MQPTSARTKPHGRHIARAQPFVFSKATPDLSPETTGRGKERKGRPPNNKARPTQNRPAIPQTPNAPEIRSRAPPLMVRCQPTENRQPLQPSSLGYGRMRYSRRPDRPQTPRHSQNGGIRQRPQRRPGHKQQRQTNRHRNGENPIHGRSSILVVNSSYYIDLFPHLGARIMPKTLTLTLSRRESGQFY